MYGHSELTRQIIGAAIEIHRHLGPGLLESTYESCLVYELEKLELSVQKQVALPVVYKDLQLPKAYRIDLLVNDQIVGELKAVDKILSVHEAQILSYLKLSQCKVGLLLNFNVKMMKDGIRRFALK